MTCYHKNCGEHREGGARTNQECTDIIKGAERIFPDLTVKVEDIVEEQELDMK